MVRVSLPVREERAMNRSLVINFILFQLGWFACVLGGAYDQVLIGCLVAISVIAFHIYQAKDTMRELRLLILALIIGIIYESLMVSLALAQYEHGQALPFIAPLWIILMWPLFATTLNLSMRWMKNLAPLLIALLGAILAPFAYLAGERLGAVVYDDIILSMSIIGIAWALLLPLAVNLSLRFDGYNEPSKRSATREVTLNV